MRVTPNDRISKTFVAETPGPTDAQIDILTIL
jgi:hypothetical protein